MNIQTPTHAYALLSCLLSLNKNKQLPHSRDERVICILIKRAPQKVT